MEFGVRGGVREFRERDERRREEGDVGVLVCNQLKPKNRKREDRNHSMAIEID